MTMRSGFFNSVNGDRKYKADFFAEYFASFIANGVFPNPSTGLQVFANDDMTVSIRPGKAWINGYYFVNDDDYILSHDVADGVLNRIDRIVLQLNYSNREIVPVIKKGTPASSPVAVDLQRDADAYELALADVYIGAGSISISQANITDTRLNTELCGIVHGTIEQVDTTTIFNQYMAWFQQVTGSTEQELANWEQQMKQDFLDWFNSLQDILDDDAAANLANRITDLDQRFTAHQADDAIGAHKATNISFAPPVGMTANNVQQAVVEAFTLGNSRKEELVDVLLLLDPSLPISYESTWEEILIATENISTGKKWASGQISSTGSIVQVNGLTFTPRIIQIFEPKVPPSIYGMYNSDITPNMALYDGSTWMNLKSGDYVNYGGFKFTMANVRQWKWVAIE